MIDYDDDDGLGYHFEKDIGRALNKILNNIIDGQVTYQSLHFTALSFRLPRQHGFEVYQGMSFTDNNRSFKAWLCKD
ncbi:hypothetical protein ACFX2G_035187 [Malus domestica]